MNEKVQGFEPLEIYIKNAVMRANRVSWGGAPKGATVASESRCGHTPKTHFSSKTVNFLMCPLAAYKDFSSSKASVVILALVHVLMAVTLWFNLK